MLRYATLLVAVAGLVAGLCACASDPMHGGEAVCRYVKGRAPVLAQATEDGQYLLWSPTAKTPHATILLKRGEPLGFKAGQSGEIIAIGGKDEYRFEEQDLYWRLNKK